MKKKVMLITLGPLVNSAGGVERVFCDMANEFSRRGYDVTIVCSENKEGKTFFPLEENVTFINTGYSRLRYKYERFMANFLLKKELRRKKRRRISKIITAHRIPKVIESVKPDIIIFDDPKHTSALTSIYRPSIPIITMTHISMPIVFNDYSRDIMNKHFSTIQVLLPSYAEDIKSYVTADRVEVIGNRVYPLHCNVDLHRKTILSVGRISKQKQQLFLVEAFQTLSSNYSDWKLELWGQIDEHDYYQKICQFIETHQLGERVQFKGVTNDIPSVLERASIFAFPSIYEGFPLAMTEAMSAGLPVVAMHDCQGVNELITHHENGILTDRSIEVFALGMESLMKDTELRYRLGNAAKESMKEYAPEKIWDKWERLIQETLEIQ